MSQKTKSYQELEEENKILFDVSKKALVVVGNIKGLRAGSQHSTDYLEYSLREELVKYYLEGIYIDEEWRERTIIRKSLIDNDPIWTLEGYDVGGVAYEFYNDVVSENGPFQIALVTWYHRQRCLDEKFSECYEPTADFTDICEAFVMEAVNKQDFRKALKEQMGLKEELFMDHVKYLSDYDVMEFDDNFPFYKGKDPNMMFGIVGTIEKFQAIVRGRRVRWKYPLAQLFSD